MKIGSEKFVLSKHLQILPLDDDHTVVAHGLALRRSVLQRKVANCLLLFQHRSYTRLEFVRTCEAPEDIADRIFTFFVENGYLVLADKNEDEEIRLHLKQSMVEPTISTHLLDTTEGNWFDLPVALSLKTFTADAAIGSERFERVNLVVLGGCFTQSAAHIIEEVALSFGLNVHVITGWPENFHLIEKNEARIVVFQPATMWLLSPLWDDSVFIDDSSRLARLQIVKDYLSIVIDKLLSYSQGRLILVQGICPPQVPPHGRMDFRLGVSFSRLVFEINSHLQELIREKPNAIFVDEARLFANYGVSYLMDDMVNVYSHHAPLDFSTAPAPESSSRMKSFQLKTRLLAVRLLAREYIECYRLWTGQHKIKCIVVDLDNTLWHGEVGDSEFSLNDYKTFEFLRYGRFGGLHQALKIVKQRGVMLATCSFNDFEEVMRHWRALGDGESMNDDIISTAPPTEGEALSKISYLLRPDDFVIHKINWKKKSENIAEISQALGIDLDSILFIDDNPIHRAELKAVFPEVRTLGSDMNMIRLNLLTDPCLEFNTQSQEANMRTEMVRSQLKRNEEARIAINESEFLKSLGIKLHVIRLIDDQHLGRITELIQRTNQFNTTGVRLDAESIRELLSDSSIKMYMAEVTDRFGAYGAVGVCIIRGSNIDSLILSCRVIELKVALPFLVMVLKTGVIPWPVTAKIIKTNRNQPCHDLYHDAGFKQLREGEYVLEDKDDLQNVDESIYEISIYDCGVIEDASN